jgi:hypothetical protein
MSDMAHPEASTLKLDAENPWPGLAAYDEGSQHFFFGREADSAELLRLVRLAPLVMLYGKSGLGKSSMLQAGVFPALREARYLPVYLRLDYSDSSRLPPLQQAQQRLIDEAHAHGHDAPPFEAGEGLWAYLQRSERPIWTADNYPVMPVLVFDQFEEVFSRGGSAEHVKAVLNSMGDLVAGRVPAELVDDRSAAKRLNLQAEQYHVVLSFRSDFLADVESWAKAANLPRREALHLQAMKRDAAIDAVERAGKAVLAPGMASRIVDFLLQKEGGAGSGGSTDVEPVLLSLCCDQLNRRRPRPGRIDEALLATVGEGILKSFYDEAMNGLDPRVPRFVEENLIQGERFRSSFPLEGALAPPDGANPEGLKRKELDHLTGSRLLRVDPQGGEPRIELIHDRLVGVVRDARDARRAVEREAEERAEAEKRAAAQQDAERLRASESERKQLLVQRTVLGTLSAVALAGMALAGYFYQVAHTETQEARQSAKDLEQTATSLNKDIELLKLDLAKTRVELAETQEKLLVAKPGSYTADLQQQAKEQVTEARTALQAKQQIAAAAAAPVPLPAPAPAAVVAPAAPAAPAAGSGSVSTGSGAAGSSQLILDDWRLSSGGCKDGSAAVTSVATFTVSEQGGTVTVQGNYTSQAKDSPYTVKGAGSAGVPLSKLGPFVEIETRHEWRRGGSVAFVTTGVDRVFIANGRPTRANLMRIRATCP